MECLSYRRKNIALGKLACAFVRAFVHIITLLDHTCQSDPYQTGVKALKVKVKEGFLFTRSRSKVFFLPGHRFSFYKVRIYT